MASKTARRLRKNPTEAEQRLWSRLRRRQLDGHFFRRQAPIGRYVVDFVCAERKLVVEVDGGQHARQIRRDAKRTAWFESLGYEVIRFWNNEVLRQTDAVEEAIREVVEPCLRTPSPQSSPSGGGVLPVVARVSAVGARIGDRAGGDVGPPLREG